ncbi:MAG: hypothetical protein JXB34_04880 [Bacteroidales bacterium]|nr:hypothetical protein [Bacteroidales bacterium]
MRINADNYEIYALDYLEGTLAQELVAPFVLFLAENPDIAELLNYMRELPLPTSQNGKPANFSYLTKNINTLTISESNFDEMCIAFHEGDLDTAMQQNLLAYINGNPKKQNIFSKYRQARLNPDKSEVFEGKKMLKKRTSADTGIRRIALISTFAAAASLATLFMFRNTNPVTQPSVISSVAVDHKKVPALIIPDTATVAEKIKITENLKKVSHFSKTQVNNKPTMLAVVDTASDNDDGIIIISSLVPRSMRIENIYLQREIASINPQINLTGQKTLSEPAFRNPIREKGVNIYAKASQITINDVIQTSINGINNMVEGDLRFESQTDERGRLTEFALSSETFNIKRKIGSN